MKQAMTPLGAVTRGLVAGAVGAGVQSGFFRLTASITPKTPEGVFDPPEREQENETATQTVARRATEFSGRRPPSEKTKARGAQLVHYGFGAMWGAVYALSRETWPQVGTPAGLAAFSTGVWMASDNMLLPAMRLAAPAHRYPLKVHAHAVAAHLAYGAGLGAAYGLLRPRSRAVLRGAALGALAWWRLRKAPVRPGLKRSTRLGARVGGRLRAVGEGVAVAAG